MASKNSDCPHILFLFSDTGGGHRSAAEAVIEALNLEFEGQVTTEMVDIFKDYAPPPFKYAPELYPRMVRIPQLWELGYRLSDGMRRSRILTASTWPYISHAAKDLVEEHPCDLIVSMHPLAISPTLKALPDDRPPYITVVTDLVSTHALWYHRGTDLCIVPTEDARQRGLIYGLPPDKIIVVGLPVADRFCQPLQDQDAIREKLGWPKDSPIILLVGGSEGMGPLEETAKAISEARLPATLVVITGHNRELKGHLESYRWDIPTLVYGFVRNMPDFMQAADILVTKAGPGTISEAFNSGLPIVLYSRVPGQEDGNVNYVISEGAGVWAPSPELIISGLRNWLEHPEELTQAAQACHRLARPQAARRIAHILMSKIGVINLI
jgi:1,2-diacylglycerol 3-beta-galactosyltransferase